MRREGLGEFFGKKSHCPEYCRALEPFRLFRGAASNSFVPSSAASFDGLFAWFSGSSCAPENGTSAPAGRVAKYVRPAATRANPPTSFWPALSLPNSLVTLRNFLTDKAAASRRFSDRSSFFECFFLSFAIAVSWVSGQGTQGQPRLICTERYNQSAPTD